MRVICGTVFLLTVLAGASFAQLPSGNVFVGYSYLNADTNTPNRANLNGWEGSAEGKVFPFLGLVLDVSGHYGTEQALSFCPRFPRVGRRYPVSKGSCTVCCLGREFLYRYTA